MVIGQAFPLKLSAADSGSAPVQDSAPAGKGSAKLASSPSPTESKETAPDRPLITSPLGTATEKAENPVSSNAEAEAPKAAEREAKTTPTQTEDTSVPHKTGSLLDWLEKKGTQAKKYVNEHFDAVGQDAREKIKRTEQEQQPHKQDEEEQTRPVTMGNYAQHPPASQNEAEGKKPVTVGDYAKHPPATPEDGKPFYGPITVGSAPIASASEIRQRREEKADKKNNSDTTSQKTVSVKTGTTSFFTKDPNGRWIALSDEKGRQALANGETVFVRKYLGNSIGWSAPREAPKPQQAETTSANAKVAGEPRAQTAPTTTQNAAGQPATTEHRTTEGNAPPPPTATTKDAATIRPQTSASVEKTTVRPTSVLKTNSSPLDDTSVASTPKLPGALSATKTPNSSEVSQNVKETPKPSSTPTTIKVASTTSGGDESRSNPKEGSSGNAPTGTSEASGKAASGNLNASGSDSTAVIGAYTRVTSLIASVDACLSHGNPGKLEGIIASLNGELQNTRVALQFGPKIQAALADARQGLDTLNWELAQKEHSQQPAANNIVVA